MEHSEFESTPQSPPSRHCEPLHYAEWQLSRERQVHEWKLLRRAIVSTRIRLVVYGHLAFFLGCVLLELLGHPEMSLQCAKAGWVSLLMTSAVLMAVEWRLVRFPPLSPPRFVVRGSGLTEYGHEGPRHHLDWLRTRQLRLEADQERPEFLSLVFIRGGPAWLERFSRISVPLPESSGAKIGALSAVGHALADNGYQWKSHVNRNDVQLTSSAPFI